MFEKTKINENVARVGPLKKSFYVSYFKAGSMIDGGPIPSSLDKKLAVKTRNSRSLRKREGER